MNLLAGLFFLIAVATVASWFRWRLWQTSAVLTATWLAAAVWWLTLPIAIVSGVVFLTILIPLNIPALRRTLLSSGILAWFRKLLPPVSETEQEAIDAGGVWWDAELFSGRSDFNHLLAARKTALSAREQAFLDGPVETLCSMLDDWQIQRDQDLPESVWTFIRQNGFLSMIIPEEHGGLGFSAQAQSAVVMKLSSANITAAVTIMVPNSLGPGELLLHYGTPEQCEHYLPRLADGREIPCFALTGPTAGSDAASIPDRGVVCRKVVDGKPTLGLRMNWEKRYITLAPVATVLGLAFKVVDPDRLIGDQEELGITCALIPTDTPGVEIGNRHLPAGSVFMNGPTRGKDVFIPMDHVIGGQARIGQGWRMLMGCLAAGRAVSLPALGTAGAKVASLSSGCYARVRQQFKMPIGYFEGVEEKLTTIAGETYRMDAARRLTMAALDMGEKPVVLSAILKYQLTEGNRRVLNAAMDIHGGKGLIEGPGNYLAGSYQAIPVSITVEGANILTRSLIIFGQGAIRCHPFLLQEMRAARDTDPMTGLHRFDRALWAHVGYTISNAVRSLVLGLTGARLASAPVVGKTGTLFRKLARMSAAFSLVSDLTLFLLGGKLKFMERLSGRFADVFGHLYLASAALKQFHDDGQPEEDLPLLQWAVTDSLHTGQEQLFGILENFPSPLLGHLLKRWVFPTGRSYRAPSDALGKQVARVLLNPGSARDRLTAGMFMGQDPERGFRLLRAAFDKVIAAAGAYRALRNALNETVTEQNFDALLRRGLSAGVITEQQATQVRDAEAARARLIAVDEFTPQQMTQRAPMPAVDTALQEAS